MQRATKIVATLGPASCESSVLERMISAGLDVARLNFSHGTAVEHQAVAQRIRAIASAAGREIALMVDLQGPKIRLGKFASGSAKLMPGQPFILDAHCEVGDATRVGLDYKELSGDLRLGDALLLNDGRIVLTVQRVVGDEIYTVVKVGGELSNNQGINRQGGGLSAPALTVKDQADIVTAVALGADYIAVSFVKSAQDMHAARQLVHAAGAPLGVLPKMIAKIERVEAIAALASIVEASDGIMVARGDLAVEVGKAAVPALQKRMIRSAREANKLVITATQMMESMIHASVPTCAEVSDVANAVLDGTDAVMLSAETAAGEYPVQTIEAMAAICHEAEKSAYIQFDKDCLDRIFTRIDQTIAMSALFTAYHLGAKAIIAFTESGATALSMSRHWIGVPIYALTSQLATRRMMALCRNVMPLHLASNDNLDITLQTALQTLVAKGLAASGDMVVITAGQSSRQVGGTNMMRIVKIDEIH